MNLAALAVAAPYALLAGGLAAPEGALGWGALAYVCLGFLGAFLAMIGAVRHAGPLRTALVFNVEPVVAIASAVLLLGETPRSEGRSVGKECVITCRSRWSPYH